jgi:DNA-binding GntR family transcriptional regulator
MAGSSLPTPDGRASELTRLSSGEQAAWRLRELIFAGDLPPHTRIPQSEIAEALGISRIPLREALIALEHEGWVTLELHRGAFVNALDEPTIRDHYEMLGLVFAFAVRRAATRSGPELLDDLRKISDALRKETDPQLAGQLIREFNYRILEAARSYRTMVLLRAIPSLIPTDIFTTLPAVVEQERCSAEEVVRALEAGDPDEAAGAVASKMRAVGAEVAAMFQERGLTETPDGDVTKPARPA